jgi:DNA invertase Pin-like site-specific DNA recombinase
MIVGYARVSTIDQTPQLQIDALKAVKCKPIYVEQKSGKNMNRPELTRCLDMLRKGDTLVIWKLDRLGRSLRDLLEIVERLENSGVQFLSLTEDINTKAASGKLIFHVFAVLADFERNLIRERTKAGLATARARGRHGGAKRKTTKKQDEGMRALWTLASSPLPNWRNSSVSPYPHFSAGCAQRVRRRRADHSHEGDDCGRP